MSPIVPNIASSQTAPSGIAPSETIVEINQLFRFFGKTQALSDVTQRIDRGMVFGLVGENGAGKTTLIKHILGLLKPTHGSVRVFGLDPVRDPVGVLGRIGYLSEDRDLPDWMTVAQLMRYNQAFYPSWDERFADQLRDQFELDPQQQVKRLSRGQRARAGLLIALAHRPDLLILDEPSSGLDPVVRNDILSAIIRSVADEGRTVLFSSHLLDEVQRVADWVMLLNHGRIALSGPLHEILHSHKRLVLRFAAPQQARPDLPGILASQGEGREWTVLCNGGLDELRLAAARVGAEVLEEETPTLDEIFLARAKVPHV
jgi:ABC-2 type transport system ATP-binding protein